MTVNEFLDMVQVGYVVQITWNGPLFDPDLIVKPGEKTVGLSKVYTCGFVAYTEPGGPFISIGIDAMYEGGNTEPSFRSVVTIPVSSIESAEIYGAIVK